MKLPRALLTSPLLVLALVACGGDDGGDNTPIIDAAPPPPDAPAGVSGLGQRCVPSMGGMDCPASAPLCVATSQTAGNCSLLCVTAGTMMTNPQGQPASVNPTPNPAVCSGAYTGGVGTGVCAAILTGGQFGYMPPHNPLMANTTYTNVHLTCVVACGANNTCPPGLTANGTGQACSCR